MQEEDADTGLFLPWYICDCVLLVMIFLANAEEL